MAMPRAPPQTVRDEGQCPTSDLVWCGGQKEEQLLDNLAPTQVSATGARDPSPLQVLHMNQEVLLDSWQRRFTYQLVHCIARLLPALVIWGGTLGLLVCALYQYRYGVLLSLTLYSFYMLHLCLSFLTFSIIGLFRVYLASSENWQEKYARTCKEGEQELGWHDILHIVMVPSYKTPLPVLQETLEALARFSGASTNLAVCLAFEEREMESSSKADALVSEFQERFCFVVSTFHPANLPNHIPGKSSNECWAFFQLCRMLKETHNIPEYDPRVVITVIDDDSELHENYFEALTYSYLTAGKTRHITTWQPPICHFKNYLRQPVLVRISSLFATLHELSCLANPLDCHVPYSSYSLSLVLASAVGGWDPEYLAEDWHMYAKCSLKTEGRIRCQPIFLPLLNYTPEEDTYCGTIASRWTQAKRHALGVSELAYVLSAMYLVILELPTPGRLMVFLWRLMPLLGKFAQVHFVNGMSAVWNVLAQLVIHFYMWRSWCYLSDLSETNGTCSMALASANEEGIAEEQVLLNSWLVYWQQRVTAFMAVLSVVSGGLGAFYFHLVKDRVEGDVNANLSVKYLCLMWLVVELEVSSCGLVSSFIFGAAPLWIACARVIQGVRFPHLVAGMVGRAVDESADV